MSTKTIAAVLATFSTIACNQANAAGFTEISVQDAGNPPLTAGLWYPSDAPVPENPNTPFRMALSLDAPISKANGGLIVLSHGYGGWYGGHADTAVALADAGYIVAAPSHTGNNYKDMSSSPKKWILDRPRHISRVIDHALSDQKTAAFVNAEKIGMYGFSAGGYTAVGLIGGTPDLTQAEEHCNEFPSEFVCAEGLMDAMLQAKMSELPASAWGADKRISAASIAAPGWAFAYPKASLENVNASVQLWSGMLDSTVPTNTNAAYLATQLPTDPETHWVENAGHFAFLTVPCWEGFKNEDPEEYKMICEDMPGFDRRAFHDNMHNEMIRFFDTELEIVSQ